MLLWFCIFDFIPVTAFDEVLVCTSINERTRIPLSSGWEVTCLHPLGTHINETPFSVSLEDKLRYEWIHGFIIQVIRVGIQTGQSRGLEKLIYLDGSIISLLIFFFLFEISFLRNKTS